MMANPLGRAAAVNSLLAFLIFAVSASASLVQTAPAERTFSAPEARVQKVLRDLHASTSGHLPVLDGFVDTSEPLDHYERGFYQCTIQESAAIGGGTTVHVTAKITAWYADPSGAHSGYRALTSNGRIESDFLDSVADALGAKPAAVGAASGVSSGVKPNSPAASGAATAKVPPAAPAPGSAAAPSGASPDGAPAASLSSMSLDAIRARREASEKKSQDLTTQVQNLEQIRQNQSHPDDIAAVKKSGTPIYANPKTDAEVLMTADAGDEFPILDVQSGWVRVQISGPSRGWIRIVQLEMPSGPASGTSKSAIETDAGPLFRVSREDTSPFAGTWSPLKDKVVKLVWVAALDTAPQQTPALAKREYAKSLFLKAYREISTDPAAVAGVVVIFDSADGGQIAATTPSVKLLSTGRVSDDEFWKQCQLDPPEAFQDTPKQ
jgi:hypothetical protein